MTKRKSTYSLLASALIAALTAVGTCVMLTNTNEGILVAYGFQNLKFFTVDSNLFVGLVHLAALLLAAAGLSEKNARIRLWIERLLYIATVAVSLTFTVVVCFFGPSIGYAPLFQDANLYFHLIIPVLSIVAFCVFHRKRTIPLWETAAALIPSVLYGLYYTAVLLARGVHFPDTDWYGFSGGGVAGSAITASGVFLTTWLLALLLRLASGGAGRKTRREHENAKAGETR